MAQPRDVQPFVQRAAARFLRVFGWQAHGKAPESRRCVIVTAPHTSNWDLLWMLAFARSFGIRPRFMMKHTVFVEPLGTFFRALGGIAIDRRKPGGMVKQMAENFEANRELALVVPPEGTRAWRDHWKSGFYRIAREADVPISLAYLDYRSRVAGFGPELRLSGNVHEDMELIRDFYADKLGRHPELFSTIRLREEDPANVA